MLHISSAMDCYRYVMKAVGSTIQVRSCNFIGKIIIRHDSFTYLMSGRAAADRASGVRVLPLKVLHQRGERSSSPSFPLLINNQPTRFLVIYSQRFQSIWKFSLVYEIFPWNIHLSMYVKKAFVTKYPGCKCDQRKLMATLFVCQ